MSLVEKGPQVPCHSPRSPVEIDTTYYVRDSEHIDIRFSFYLLTSLRLNQFDRSTAIPGLNRDDAYDLVVDLPPLSEQRRIVAKIEELFSELDKGVESLKTARAKLNVYRQSVLKHAFEGKLTANGAKRTKTSLKPLSGSLPVSRKTEKCIIRRGSKNGRLSIRSGKKKEKTAIDPINHESCLISLPSPPRKMK